jgi:hypothetical protein
LPASDPHESAPAVSAGPAGGEPRRLAREGAVLGGYLLLAVLQTGLWSGLGSRLYTGPDPTQDVWVLNWVARHLIRSPGQVFEGNNFFPSRDAILFCDPLLGPAAVAAPLALVVDNPLLLYNLTLLSTLALGSYGSHRLARHLWGESPGTLLAGVCIPYTSLQLHHLIHLNLLTVAGFPYLILGLLWLLRSPSFRPGLLTALAFVLQAGTSGYHAISSAILAVTVAAWDWRRFAHWRTWAFCGLAAAAAGLLLAPYLMGFAAHGREADMARSLEVSHHYSVSVPNWFFRTSSYAWRPLFGSAWEPVWPGLIPLVMAARGLRRPWTRELKLLLLVASVFFVLSLGPYLTIQGTRVVPLPFKWMFQNLPFFSAIKHPVTFMVPVFISLGLLAARGLARSRSPWVIAAVLALAVIETLSPTPPRHAPGTEPPEIYRLLAAQPPGALLELPAGDTDDTRAQWWSIFHGRPVVNGMAAFSPRQYLSLQHVLRKDWGREPPHDLSYGRGLAMLRTHFPIRYLVLQPTVPGPLRRNVDLTAAFRLLAEAKDGARLYSVHNGQTAALIKRRLRPDQVRRGLRAAFHGPAGAALRVTFNDRVLEERRLTGQREEAVWHVPEPLVLSGDNYLTLILEGGELDLEGVTWAEPGEDAPGAPLLPHAGPVRGEPAL